MVDHELINIRQDEQIDLHKLKNYLNPKNLCYLGIIVGCALVFFGITICFKEIKL